MLVKMLTVKWILFLTLIHQHCQGLLNNKKIMKNNEKNSFTDTTKIQWKSRHKLKRFYKGKWEKHDGVKCKTYQWQDKSCKVETLSWAVKLSVPDENYSQKQMDLLADQAARDLGLVNKGQIGHLFSHYLFSHPVHEVYSSVVSKGNTFIKRKLLFEQLRDTSFAKVKSRIHKALDMHVDTEWYTQQMVHCRRKRGLLFNDPSYSAQWHLVSMKFILVYHDM